MLWSAFEETSYKIVKYGYSIIEYAFLDKMYISKLDPLLSEADAFTLITTGVNCLFKLPDCPLMTSKGKEELKENEIKGKVLCERWFMIE